MSWESVKLADIKEDSLELPAGNYTFQIAPKSAGYREWNNGQQLQLRLTVVEGESKGRAFFLQYNDPSTFDNPENLRKMLQGLKKLQSVLGVDQEEGEDLAAYFNRVAADGQPKFSANIAEAKPYVSKNKQGVVQKDENGEPIMKPGRAKFLPFSVKAAV